MKTSAQRSATRTKKSATKKSATGKTSPKDDQKSKALRCAALTQKGTHCRLKPVEGSDFCARHQEAAPASKRARDVTDALPAGFAAGAARNGAAAKRGRDESEPSVTQEEPAEAPAAAPSPTDPPAEGLDEEQEQDIKVADEWIADAELYGSEWSSTLEASPYDEVTPQMASGEEDVELLDESEMGPHSRRRESAPPVARVSRDDAEAQAREKLGPRPEIAPEEDLDGELAHYDRAFDLEVRRLMGLARKRGRRGGRRRRGRGGGGQPAAGQDAGRGPQRGRKRRGRRGGRGRGQGHGDPEGTPAGGRRARPVGRRGGGPGRSKVARDSPLAERRGSRGPKRGVQPRRRREPDV